MDKYEKQHQRNLSAYERQVDAIFNQAIKEAALIGVSVGELADDEIMSFDKLPKTKKAVSKMMNTLASSLTVCIVNGVQSSWTLANNKDSELCDRVFGDAKDSLNEAQRKRYYSNNSDALQAFLSRKEAGLNLSERVWKYVEEYKEEIEMGLDLGLRDGVAAERMQRDLQQYLQHPDMLFRRVRDVHGHLQLSKRAKAYHPGAGVYRSSYKNARRLTVTETNMAYRTADYLRWQELDFVVGIRVVLSNNHPEDDICNALSAPMDSTATEGRGCYPKDFKFTGWHPHCRCHAETILKTEGEIMRDNARLLNDEEPLKDSVNKVSDVPQAFKDWLDDNKKRAERSTSVPYFISDNEKYLPVGYKNLYALKTPYETYAEYEAAMRFNKKHADFTPEVLENIRDLDQALPVMQGKIMNFTEADELKGNPHYSDPDASKEGYLINCQTCTMTYELRRRGFPVEAMPNKNNEFYDVWCPNNNLTWLDRFLNPDGSRPIKTRPSVLRDTITAKVGFIEDATQEVGRYELYLKWKPVKVLDSKTNMMKMKDRGAHVMIVERQKDSNLLWFDPQSGKHGSPKIFNGFMKNAVPIQICVLRIDDKIINPKFAERLKKASK